MHAAEQLLKRAAECADTRDLAATAHLHVVGPRPRALDGDRHAGSHSSARFPWLRNLAADLVSGGLFWISGVAYFGEYWSAALRPPFAASIRHSNGLPLGKAVRCFAPH